MTTLQIAFLLLVFLSVFGIVFFTGTLVTPSAVRQRLHRLLPSAGTAEESSNQWIERAARMTAPLGKLSLPDEGWDQSGIRIRLMNAGIRNASAPTLYFGAKTLFAVILPVVLYVYLTLAGTQADIGRVLPMLLLAATLGYYLPNLILSHLVTARQREIFECFPDALDLMTVCVEAGLGIEAAINRVAGDLEHKSRVLSEELRLVGLEWRAGSDRKRALRNLAVRTGVEEVGTWVAMVVQAERFGTGIAAALRVHSEMLRTKRRQRAEEAAAKIGLKLMFPLIFCIFPSLMLVLLGPAFIQIYRVMLPAMGGGQ